MILHLYILKKINVLLIWSLFNIETDRDTVLDELIELPCKLTGVPKSLISIVD